MQKPILLLLLVVELSRAVKGQVPDISSDKVLDRMKMGS